jgi:flagellar motor switch protein FliN/FliY
MAEEPGKDNLEGSESTGQNEIDALLHAASVEGGEPAAATESTGGAATPAADSSVSQADIEAAIAEGGDDEDSGLVRQAEIDAVIAGADDADVASGAAIDDPAGAMPVNPVETGEGDLPLNDVDLPDFTGEESEETSALQSIDLLNDVDLRVRIELGRTRMYVEDVLRLGEGSVVELDKLAGDPVDVFVNERLVARGEVLVLNDNFCVRVSEIISDENERILD